MRSIIVSALLVVGLTFLSVASADAEIVRSASGASASVSPSMASKARCLIVGLEGAGVPIKFMGGYGKRKFGHSKHPSGRAIDINQWRRDVTRPQIPRAIGNRVAGSCGLISGGAWSHRPDNGHFEESGGGSKAGR